MWNVNVAKRARDQCCIFALTIQASIGVTLSYSSRLFLCALGTITQTVISYKCAIVVSDTVFSYLRKCSGCIMTYSLAMRPEL